MNRISSDFDEILNKNIDKKQLIQGAIDSNFRINDFYKPAPRVYPIDCALCGKKVREIIELLNNEIFPILSDKSNIQITELTREYKKYFPHDSSPFSARFKGADVDEKQNPRLYSKCKEIGILELVMSKSLRQFVAGISGERFRYGNGMPKCQLICYQDGDYIGLHSDWNESIEKIGTFLVCHINLPDENTDQQLLIYENGGQLNGLLELTKPMIVIMRQPFWHMTTPLKVRSGTAKEAKRWSIVTSFQIR